MVKGIQFIQVVEQRGRIMVQGMGRTGRGTKFIVKQVEIDSPGPRSKGYKEKQAAAVKKLFESEE